MNPLAPFLPYVALFLLLAPLLSLPACYKPPPTAAPSTTALTIAAAASVKPAIDAAADLFHKSHPDITITAISGASGHFFEQIQNKAPFDLFYSADTKYPRRLVEAGLALPGSQRTYATGQLVLWVRSDLGLDPNPGLQVLLNPAIKKIAIANPDTAPYGAAAVAALKSKGVHDQVKDRLVLGENVEQAAHFVQTGAAEAALLPISLTMTGPLAQSGRSWTIPQDAHPPIEHGMIILLSTAHAEAARAFDAFLAGPEGRAILTSRGFGLPRE